MTSCKQWREIGITGNHIIHLFNISFFTGWQLTIPENLQIKTSDFKTLFPDILLYSYRNKTSAIIAVRLRASHKLIQLQGVIDIIAGKEILDVTFTQISKQPGVLYFIVGCVGRHKGPGLAGMENRQEILPLFVYIRGLFQFSLLVCLCCKVHHGFEECYPVIKPLLIIRDIIDQSFSELFSFSYIISLFIPVIHLQGNQNPDHYQQNLSDGVQQILCKRAGINQFLANASKKCNHVEFLVLSVEC